MSEPFVTNVLSYKYDTALDYHVTMYDKLPYQRDSDYCNIEKVCLYSGKVLKYFLYVNEPEIAIIDNRDDEFEEFLMQLKLKQQRQNELARSGASAPELPSDGVTDEQIQTLLDDQEDDFSAPYEPENDDDEDAALADSSNPFADVEDW